MESINKPYISAKEHGFEDGIFLERGAIAPSDYTTIRTGREGEAVAVPTQTVFNSFQSYGEAVGGAVNFNNEDPTKLGTAYSNAAAVLASAGVFNSPDSSRIAVGVNSRGNTVYSDAELSQDKEPTRGQMMSMEIGQSLANVGGFTSGKDIESYVTAGQIASSTDFYGELDKSKSANDPKDFISKLSKINNRPLDKNTEGLAGYDLYENWGQLSVGQKSMALNALSLQTYRFSDGSSLSDRVLTTDKSTGRAITALDSIELGESGVNTAPLVRNWDQYNLVQDTMFDAPDSKELANNISSMGFLGSGIEGAAVKTNESSLAKLGAAPASNMGVGALTIKAGMAVPQGYTQVASADGSKVIIPMDNVSTVAPSQIDPKIVKKAAQDVYSTWDTKGKKERIPQGLVGGSALVSGLSKMSTSNPYALGALTGYSTLQNLSEDKYGTSMDQVISMAAVSLGRVVSGSKDEKNDNKYADMFSELRTGGEFSKDTFNSSVKTIKAAYARNGISNKETAYQLANQAYSEGRLNETDLVAIQNTFNMVYDETGANLAQRLLTGRNKSVELINKRREK